MQGLKTYIVAAAMALYALAAWFLFPPPYQLTPDQALAVLSAAGALVGIRSALTTEVQKLLAALGIDVTKLSAAATPDEVQGQAAPLVNALRVIASPKVAKAAVLLLFLGVTTPFLSGCQTFAALTGSGSPGVQLCSTPSQCVYQAKGVFAAALAVVNGYAGLPTCPTAAPICKDEGIVDSVRKLAHSTKDTLDAADSLVNSGLLPSDPVAISAAKSATDAAASFQTVASALPHK